MIKLYKYEAIDEDTCYEKCIEDLDVYASDINLFVFSLLAFSLI